MSATNVTRETITHLIVKVKKVASSHLPRDNVSVRDFITLVSAQWEKSKFLCVGLDPDIEKIPAHILGTAEEKIVTFLKEIIDATKDEVCAFKPNSAFYEAYGEEGWRALKTICDYIHAVAPGVAIILDAKRGDIGNTNEFYARMAFDYLQVDAITIQPYQGGGAVKPFLERKNKGIFVLCRTSNEGAEEFQSKVIDGEPLYVFVAKQVVTSWNANENCALVMGATAPEELKVVRTLSPDIPLLIPGFGAQGGDLAATVRAAQRNFILNASRSILYASSGMDFATVAHTKAREASTQIQELLV